MKWKSPFFSAASNLIKIFASAIVLVAVLPKAAPASTMLYTFSGQGSGVFDGQIFSYVNVTITSTLDTSQIMGFGNGVYVLTDAGGANLTISGLGAAIFSDTNHIFVSQRSQEVGITGYNRSGTEQYIVKLGLFGAEGSTYDLSTPTGPLQGYNLLPLGLNGPFATSAGDFGLNSWTPAFTATIVPEPNSEALFIVGGFAFGRLLVLRRRAQFLPSKKRGSPPLRFQLRPRADKSKRWSSLRYS